MNRAHRNLLAAVCAVTLPALGLAATAHAQEAETPDPSAAPTEPAAPAESAAPAADPAMAPATAPAAPAADPGMGLTGIPKQRDYERVHTIQRNPVSKLGQLELAILTGPSVNPRFTWHYGFSGSLVYHLREALGFEFGIMGAPGPLGGATEFDDELKNKISAKALSPRLQLEAATNVGIQIAPMYGKFELLGALGHYDLYFSAGAGAAFTKITPSVHDISQSSVRSNAAQREELLKPVRDVRLLGTWGAGFRIMLSNWVGIRAELRDYLFSAKQEPLCVEGLQNDPNCRQEGAISDVFNGMFFFVGASFMVL